MSNLINFNIVRALDLDGMPVSGAQAFFFDSGTDQARTVYADIGATVPHPQPVIADANGIFPSAYAEGGTPVRVVMRDADGVMVSGYPLDPVMMTPAGDAQASSISFNPTGDIPALNVQRAIEIVQASNVDPLNDVGWGVTGNAELIDSIDVTNKPSGVYRFDATTLGTFPSGVVKADGGIVRIERRAALAAVMWMQAAGNNVQFTRVLSNTWGSWAQILDAGTHDQATWNAALNAVPKAVSPVAMRAAVLAAPLANTETRGLMSPDHAYLLGFGTAPVGSVMMFAGSVAPNGWLFCRGQSVSRTGDATLFSVIGTTYGAGNGTTTFNLPNISGRSPVGAGPGGVFGVTERWLGQLEGTETVALTEAQMPSHRHEGNTDPNGRHKHGVYRSRAFDSATIDQIGSDFGRGQSTGAGGWTDTGVSEDGNHSHGFQTNEKGGSASHPNMHPFIGINFIIRVR